MTETQGRLIVLSGLDGSGKSTHMRWITGALEEQGARYRTVWLRWVMMTSVPVLAYGRLRGYSRRLYNSRSRTMIVEPLYYQSTVMRTFWPRLFALDVALAAWWRVLRPLRHGDWVVCDRYVLDVIVDIAAILRDESVLHTDLTSHLLSLIPADACTIVIDVEPQIAFDRKQDVLDLAYLERRRPLYLELARRTGAIVVDGSAGFRTVQDTIASAIGIRPLPEHAEAVPPGAAS